MSMRQARGNCSGRGDLGIICLAPAWAFPSNAAMLNTEFFASETPGSKDLLVVLHGLGDSSAGFHWLPEALDLPAMNYLLVNAPDSYYGGYSWYDFTGDEAAGVERSRRL